MKLLALRKELLIAESDLNRAQLVQECQAFSSKVSGMTERVKSFNAVALSMITLANGVLAFAGHKAAVAPPKVSWFHKVLNGARLASSVWLAFRTLGADSAKR